MEIAYDFVQELDVIEVSEVFRNSGINRPVSDYERLQKMIDNANIIVTARFEGKLVGIARGLTDYAWCCYLSDLAVDKDFQRMGIGRNLTRKVRNKLGEGVKLLLVATPSAVEYYPHIGFKKVERAFDIPRRY